MKKVLLFIVALVFGPLVFAQDDWVCKNWQSHGQIRTLVEKWDLLLATADKNKTFLKDINEFKRKYGLLLEVSPPTTKMDGPPPDRLEGESPSGTTWALFFKRVTGFKCCLFDHVWEVGALDGKKKLQSWSVPLDASPLAIEGNELFIEYQLRGCTNESRGVTLAIKPDGSFRVVDRKLPTLDESKKFLGPLCTAPKMVFPESKFGVCSELEDLKNQKKRILVWETPMT